ncbi:MAG: hypothetical protein J5727_09955 [Kiritimatiellae bacterium]|nr:hypothetical protein [Kiritimatiellia bacterium]
MPIVLLMCSAVFELIGFWDAQIMANHAAWQVGRIASVRGDDGMVFSDTVAKISKTGVVSEKMPKPIQDLLKPLVTSIGGTIQKFNDRGVITTMFLMSTCEIGYYGSSPGTALAESIDKLISDLLDGLPQAINDSVDSLIKEKLDWLPAGSGIIGSLVSKLINKLVEVALEPILKYLKEKISEAAKKFLELIDVDKLFSGGSAAARRARQIYGAAARVVKAAKPVSSVTELKTNPYVFGDEQYSNQGRLVYPLVIDKDASSDGYFITGAHGWPPNNQALRLLKVEVNWPYSRGWVFPVVAGYGKKSAPVAKGTSIVFPQPNIVDKNLWSTGAVAYAEGDFTNKISNAYEQVADAMKKYLALAQFGMKYRLHQESINLVDEQPEWYHSGSPKHCSPLYELFEKNKDGDYADCWSRITDGKSQSAYMKDLEDYFKRSSYNYRDYFYWEGTWHKRYADDLLSWNGARGFWSWCGDNPAYCASSAASVNDGFQEFWFNKYLESRSGDISRAKLLPYDVSASFKEFRSGLGGLKLRDLVQWMDPSRYQEWLSMDMKAQKVSKESADTRFKKIRDLLNTEINDIQKILDNKMDDYTGDDGDSFIIDPDDQKAIDDPEAASQEAMAKWNARRAELKLLLQDIDRKIASLNNAWWVYKDFVGQVENDRKWVVSTGLSQAYVSACILEKTQKVFTPQEFASILRNNKLITYDIIGKTAELVELQDKYCAELEKVWNAEVEYGSKLGLASAKKAKKSGKPIDDIDMGKDVYPEDEGGTLKAGSDKGWPIDKDNETWSRSGGWK